MGARWEGGGKWDVNAGKLASTAQLCLVGTLIYRAVRKLLSKVSPEIGYTVVNSVAQLG